MAAIILAALQILLLLLKAHFSKDENHEKAMDAIREAQGKLNDVAMQFEQRIRFSAPPHEQVDRVQDLLDKDRNKQN